MYLIFIQIVYAILSTLILLNYSHFLGKKFNLIDKPNKNNIHKKDVPLIGGIVLLNLFISTEIFLYLWDILKIRIFLSLLFSTILFFIIGFFDDLKNLSGSKRTLLFFFASLFFLYMSGIYTDLTKIFFVTYKNSVNMGLWGLFFFTLCLVGLQIVFNLIDGINGLLKIYFISSLIILDLYVQNNIGLMIKILLIPFFIMLIFNFQNKFFLGSSGNSILSLITAYVLFVNLSNQNVLIYFEQIFLLFLIPFTDCLRLFIYRLVKFKNIFIKQKNHLHHYLIKKYSITKTLFVYFFISFLPSIIYYLFQFNIYIIIFFTLISYFILLNFLNKAT